MAEIRSWAPSEAGRITPRFIGVVLTFGVAALATWYGFLVAFVRVTGFETFVLATFAYSIVLLGAIIAVYLWRTEPTSVDERMRESEVSVSYDVLTAYIEIFDEEAPDGDLEAQREWLENGGLETVMERLTDRFDRAEIREAVAELEQVD